MAALDDLVVEMNAAGLEDLVVLVINVDAEYSSTGDSYVAAIEDYDLPVLQDTEEAGVAGAWDARSYDTFIVGRGGQIDLPLPDTHPGGEDGHAMLVEALSHYL